MMVHHSASGNVPRVIPKYKLWLFAYSGTRSVPRLSVTIPFPRLRRKSTVPMLSVTIHFPPLSLCPVVCKDHTQRCQRERYYHFEFQPYSDTPVSHRKKHSIGGTVEVILYFLKRVRWHCLPVFLLHPASYACTHLAAATPRIHTAMHRHTHINTHE